MIYSDTERAKIHENLDQIKGYLYNLMPILRDKITISFGQSIRYADYSIEPAYHISISDKGITCRAVGLVFDFYDEKEASAYKRLDYAVALMQNWNTIKMKINEEMQAQQRMINAINNFKL